LPLSPVKRKKPNLGGFLSMGYVVIIKDIDLINGNVQALGLKTIIIGLITALTVISNVPLF
jgi:hypothetical protein